MNTIGILVHPARDEAKAVAERLADLAVKRGLAVAASLDAGCELIVAVGGDGTFLGAAADALRLDVPLVGVNVGNVGYLAEIDRDGIETAVERLAAGEYEVSNRSTVAATLPDGSRHVAVNDIVFEKEVSQRVVHLAISIDGMPFARYRADGVILATANGSTAYSFSAGGPVVDPQLDLLVLTPVAAHSAFPRPLVLRHDAVVEVAVASERRVRINRDGSEVAVLDEGASATVTGGRETLRVVDFDSRPYPHTVFEQFGPRDA